MRLRLLIIPCIIMVASMTVIRIALAAQPDSPDVPRYQDGGVLTLGQTVNGTLSPSVPENQWSLVAPQESRANLTLTRMAGSAPLTVMIYNPAGTIIVSLNTDTQGLASLPQLYLEGGTYSVKVRADFTTTAQETSFTLSIQSNTVTAVTPVPTMTRTLPPTVPPDQLAPTITPLPSLDTPTPTIVPSPVGPPPVRLEIGEVYEGELTTPGDTHRFSFVGYAESFITFGVSRVDDDRETTLDPYIWLQAPSGETIAEADDHADSDDALVIHLPLEATGVYTLFLNSSDNQGVGPYRVAIGEGFIRYDVDQGGAAHDQPLIASIADYGVRDVWTIDVESGDLISISVEAWDESPLDPMVELVAPTGETLAFDDDSGAGGNAFLSSIPAPVTGTYRIHIAAYSHASLGSYRLWWRRDNLFPTPTAAPATATSPVSNSATVTPTGTPFTIDIPTGTPIIATTESSPTPILSSSGSLLFDLLEGEQLVQPIELDAGQQLNIFVEGHWGFDGVLEIVAPGGQVLQRVDDIGFGETFDINPRLVQDIATSGRYTIRVYGYENSGGTFTLHWLIR